MLKVELRCPKHPKFSPLQGEEAIKGGCFACYRLITIERIIRKWKMSLEKYYGYSLNDEEADRKIRADRLLSLSRRVVTKLREDQDLTEEEEIVLGSL